MPMGPVSLQRGGDVRGLSGYGQTITGELTFGSPLDHVDAAPIGILNLVCDHYSKSDL